MDNVPPPPKSQPPKIEELTSALEKQLSEIEKHVVEKRKQNDSATSKPVLPFNQNISSSQFAAAGSSSATTSAKFGNSMREMLKNVVSSQKNVLNKKVETIEKTGKVGSFFKNLTKNSLSRSSQSLSKSKDSLVMDQTVLPDPKQTIVTKDVKKRSKSLSCDNRTGLSDQNKTLYTNRSELGPGSNPVNGNRSRAEAGVSRSRWLGKNPFDTDKSPATEVNRNKPYRNELNPFLSNDNGSNYFESGLSQAATADISCYESAQSKQSAAGLVGPGQNGPQRGPEKESSALGEQSAKTVKISQKLVKSPENGIAALIQECEDYVKTEEFTKDLGSEILKMFMAERQNITENPNFEQRLRSESNDSLYDNDREVVMSNGMESIDSVMMKHEESPDSNDSAYDSDKKDLAMTHQFYLKNNGSKSSSLIGMDEDCISNASTIKNQLCREESISYDTVLR